MTDRERTVVAAVETLVGGAMAVAGFLLLSAREPYDILGGVLLLFGLVALGQAVAVGLGLFTPTPAKTESQQKRRHRPGGVVALAGAVLLTGGGILVVSASELPALGGALLVMVGAGALGQAGAQRSRSVRADSARKKERE